MECRRASLGLEAVDDLEKEDYEGEAVWEDLKLGASHTASFERIAVVTDARWAGPAVKVFSVL